MSDAGRRGILLALTLLALPLTAWNYAERVRAIDLGVEECLNGGDLCVGKTVGWGFGRVLIADAEEPVLSLRGGYEVTLVGWNDRPPLRVGLVVSVAATYVGEGRLTVQRYRLHPLRAVKEAVGILGLLLWLGMVGRFALRRLGPGGH